MDLAAESSVLNRSTFFTGSRLSFLLGCPHRNRIRTDNLSLSLRSASRIPANCVGPCIRGNFFSSRFQESAVFDGRALSRSVAAKFCRNNGFKDSSAGVNFGFLEVLVKRGVVLAAMGCGFLVLGCRRAFAVKSVVNADYGVIGQRMLLLKGTWPKLLQVLGVFKEQGLVLAALLGLSAFFSMAETSITTLWHCKE